MMIAAAFRSLLALILFGGALSFDSATPAPTRVPASATCSEVVANGTPTAESYTDCTTSPPWWTTYTSCPITPIHTERYTGTVNLNEEALYVIPWLKLDSPDGTAIAHLFYGNRPVHTNATFGDGSKTKVLWQTSPRVLDFKMTATSLSNSTQAVVSMTDFSSAGVDWASYVNIPKPGCWRVDVGGTTESGTTVTWSAVFVVVE